MSDFPSNSHQAKTTEPREPIKPVTSAAAVRRKQGLGRKFKETFFRGTGKEALGFMVEDVVVPSITDLMYEAIHRGLDHVFYGDSRGGARRGVAPTTAVSAGHVAYNRMNTSSTVATPQQQRTLSKQSRARHDFDVIISSRQEATEVLDCMFDMLSQYGEVSVAHLYALTGIESEHTDFKWGWTNLKGAKVLPNRSGGYLLALPKAGAL